MEAPLSIFCALTLPALAAGPLSWPTPLPGDATIGPAAGTQDQPALVEGDGATWLATWRDTRAQLAGTLGSDATDVYAIRLGADGRPLDDVPFPVASGPWSESSPRAAWNHTHWLVAYDADAEGAGWYSQGVYARRVNGATGEVDADAVLLANEAYDDEVLWDVASDGSGWAVLWQAVDDRLGSYVLDGAVVDGLGAAATGRVYTPASLYGAPWNARIAWNGERYLAVWSAWGEDDDVEALPLDAALGALGPVRAVAGDGRSSVRPTLAAADGSFYVAWYDDTFGAFWGTVRGSPVGGDGAPVVLGGEDLSGDAWPLDVHPDAAWMGDRWGVAWEYGAAASVYTSRVNVSGGLEGFANATGDADYTRTPSVAGGEGQLLLAYATYGDRSDFDVEAVPVDRAGLAGAAQTLSLGAPAQTAPALAGGRRGYLAVVRSETADETRILGWRTDAYGVARDPAPIELARGSELRDPKVAWNGSVWLVVWTDLDPATAANGVVGRRVRPDGAVLDPTPIALITGEDPAVAASSTLGGDFLVAGVVPVTYDTNRLAGVRVSSAGVVLDPSPVTLGTNFVRDPDVSPLGAGWIVTWPHYHSHDSGLSEVLYATVSAEGAPSAAAWIRTSGSLSRETHPSVATDGTRALVVWSDSGDLRGRFVDSGGAAVGAGTGFVVSAQPNDQFEPDVAWNGRSFAVAWTDWRAHGSLEPGEGDVYVTHVSGAGRVESPVGTPLSVDEVPEGNPAVAGAGGRTVFAWTRLHEESPYAAFRVLTANQMLARPSLELTAVGPEGGPAVAEDAAPGAAGLGCSTGAASPGLLGVALGGIALRGRRRSPPSRPGAPAQARRGEGSSKLPRR